MEGNLQQGNTATAGRPRSRAEHIFLGPAGLRAGWGALLFLLLFLAAYFVLGWALQPVFKRLAHAHTSTGGTLLTLGPQYLVEVMVVLCVATATFVTARIEKRPFLSYGYVGRDRGLLFLAGLGYGLLAISAMVGVLAAAGLIVICGPVLAHGQILHFAIGWGGFFLLVALFEESALRGYLQYTLARGLGFRWAAILLSCLFGFSHGLNPGETPVGLFSAAGVGLVLCLSLWYTGSLYWALGFHAAWDWGESFLYGTSDSGVLVQGRLLASSPVGKPLWSGGATGPEGSILVLVLLVIVALCMWLWWGRRQNGISPFQTATATQASATAAEDASSPVLKL